MCDNSDCVLEYGYVNHDCLLARQMEMAQRELGAFLHVVAESYGPEAAAISADDWLDKLTLLDWVGEPTPSDWRLVTIAAASRLATRVKQTRRGQDRVGVGTGS